MIANVYFLDKKQLQHAVSQFNPYFVLDLWTCVNRANICLDLSTEVPKLCAYAFEDFCSLKGSMILIRVFPFSQTV